MGDEMYDIKLILADLLNVLTGVFCIQYQTGN